VTDLSERPRATSRSESNRLSRALSVIPARGDTSATFLSAHPPSWNGLLEALPEPTALLDGDGVVHYVNGLLTALTDYAPSELIGQDVVILVPERLRERLLRMRRERPRDAVAAIWNERDLTIQRRDGQEIPVEVTRSPSKRAPGWWSQSVT